VLYVKDASGTVDSVSHRLAEAAGQHGMQVVGVHDIKQQLDSGGAQVAGECRVLEVWNSKRTQRALQMDMAVLTVLPSRIAVYSFEDRVRIAFVKPTVLMDMYQHPALEPIAQEAENAMICLVEAVCR
jgi:uncharacterized protein (DUF302 family)